MIDFKKLIFTLFSLLLWQSIFAQSYQVFASNKQGNSGAILRIETYEEERLIEIRQFGEKTQPTTTIKQQFDKQGRLIERKQTFHEETEYDLIRQYTYDDEGRKIGELFGNNRTGKWGSFRYSYTAVGAIDTIFVFQKNGELTDLRIFEYVYSETQQKLKEFRVHRKIATGKNTLKTIIEYAYPDTLTTRITCKNAAGDLLSGEILQRTSFGEILEETIILPTLGTVKTINKYNQRQQLTQTKELENDQLIRTISYQYNNKGQIRQKTIKNADGTINGELYKLLE